MDKEQSHFLCMYLSEYCLSLCGVCGSFFPFAMVLIGDFTFIFNIFLTPIFFSMMRDFDCSSVQYPFTHYFYLIR